MRIRKKKTEKRIIYNPLRMTDALREVGAQLERKETLLYYFAVLSIAVALAVLLEIAPVLIAVVVVVYAVLTPTILYNNKRQAFEKKRFNDVNAYMRQMAQSFIDTQNVIDSLTQTAETFSSGRMKNTLDEALDIINKQKSDIEAAKRMALHTVENAYGCEKLKNLHDFLLLAENRGGHCEKEFTVLEKMRNAWKQAVAAYHTRLLTDKILGTAVYITLLIFCVIFLNVFRIYGMDIFDVGLTQITNAVMIVILLFYYVRMDRRLNTSYLKVSKAMSKEKADGYFAFLNSFDKKKARRKYLLIRILSLIAGGAVVFLFNNAVSWVMAAVIVMLGFNIHNISLLLVKYELRQELLRAFPKWLFDVILLIQRESVEGAIKLSVDKAPPVMQSELTRISRRLDSVPHDKDAYISFFADFNILEIEEAMRTLYSLAVGTGGTGEVMSEVIESNVDLLNEAEKNSIEAESALSGYTTIPFLIVSFGFLMYMVVTIGISVGKVMGQF